LTSFIKTPGGAPVYTLGSIDINTGARFEYAGKSGTRYASLAYDNSVFALGLKKIPGDPQGDFGLYQITNNGTEVLKEELDEIGGTGFSDPLEVAYDGTNAVVFGGTFPEIVEVNLTTSAVTNYSVSYPYPFEKDDMDLTAAGDVIVGFNATNPLAIVTRTTGASQIFAPLPGIGTGEISRYPAMGKMAFRAANELVVETNEQSFWRYNLSTGVRDLFSGPHQGSPWVAGINGGMATDGAGTVFVTGNDFFSPYPGFEKILKMDSAGALTQLGLDMPGETHALAYSGGFVYAMPARRVPTGTTNIYSYNATSGARTTLGSSATIYYPIDIKPMPNGKFVVAHNQVYSDVFPFDPLGQTGLSIFDPGTGVFSPVAGSPLTTGATFPDWISGVVVDSNTKFSIVVDDPYGNVNSGIYRIDTATNTIVRVSPDETSRLYGQSLIATAANKTLQPIVKPVTALSTNQELDFGHAGVRMNFASIASPGSVTVTPVYTAPPNLSSPALQIHWSISGLAAGTFNTMMTFEYNDVLLKESGLAEANLGLYRSSDNGATWVHVPEVLDPSLNQVRTAALQSGFSLWALAELSASGTGDAWQMYN
ncbi:MAG: hypothetical protein ABI579_04075, partial [Candidatus Sumerlaeota bacterium]